MSQFRFQKLYRTNKRKRNKDFTYELREITDGKVENTTEGDNVDVEEPDQLAPSETSRGPVAISKASYLENPGG